MIANRTGGADVTRVWRAEWLAGVVVLGVAITWGVSFAVVKATVGEVSPSRLVGWRFVVASFTLLAIRPRVVQELDRRTVARGAVLGALLGIGFVLCTVGMQTTSVLISAFLIGTTVVLAPLIAWIWLRRRLAARAAAAVSLAFIGLAMITIRGVAVGPGTLLILAAAVLWAAHLVALGRWSRGGRLHGLTLVQLATAAAVALGCLLVFQDEQGLWQPMSMSAAVGIVYLGAIATGGAFLALSWAQTRLDVTTTAVILALEPLAGAGLGVALGDTWTVPVLAGGIAVLSAVLLVAWTGGRAFPSNDLILERFQPRSPTNPLASVRYLAPTQTNWTSTNAIDGDRHQPAGDHARSARPPTISAHSTANSCPALFSARNGRAIRGTLVKRHDRSSKPSSH
jgi:drug/metabolite transporter (DMT)-like permease